VPQTVPLGHPGGLAPVIYPPVVHGPPVSYGAEAQR
jgi:hypothetical protein